MLNSVLKLTLFVSVVVAIAVANLPQPLMPDVLDDNQLHMIGFSILATLAAIAYPTVSLIRILVAMMVLGALIEFAQDLSGLGRSANLNDWLADIAGTVAALAVIGVWRRLAHSTSSDV